MSQMTFDAELLDEVLLAGAYGLMHKAWDRVEGTDRFHIGAITELIFSREQHQIAGISSKPFPRILESVDLAFRRREFTSGNLSLAPLSFEFCSCPCQIEGFSSATWIAFSKRLQCAAKKAGFGDSLSAGIAGTFQEMADNAFKHCEVPETAVGGYQWHQNEFEFVVADSGIGVLKSLQTCGEYAAITEHGDALLQAVKHGASRFGSGLGHGQGFRQLFTTLASLQGVLRFRSGDQALRLRGQALGAASAQLFQRPTYQGFIVSVRCSPDPAS